MNPQIGNAWIDNETNAKGRFDYIWTHALCSDEMHATIDEYCDFASDNVSDVCHNATAKVFQDLGKIDLYSIYAPVCHETSLRDGPPGSVSLFLPHYSSCY